MHIPKEHEHQSKRMNNKVNAVKGNKQRCPETVHQHIAAELLSQDQLLCIIRKVMSVTVQVMHAASLDCLVNSKQVNKIQ